MERYKRRFIEESNLLPNNLHDFYKQLSSTERKLIYNPYPQHYTNLSQSDFLNNFNTSYENLFKLFFIKFNFPLKIYRQIQANSIEDVNWNKIGIYWTYNLNAAKNFWGNTDKNSFIIEGLVKKDVIDWNKTMILNLVTTEDEIRINSKNKIKIIGYKHKKDTQFQIIKKDAIS